MICAFFLIIVLLILFQNHPIPTLKGKPMTASTSPLLEESILDKVIANYQDSPGELLSILEDLQELNPNNYLPLELLNRVAVKTNVPLSQIYGVATFYAFFNLKPQGRHTICICRGTACHTRGSRNLLESLKTMMDVNDEAINDADKLSLTTSDNEYTIRTVACFGQCALAPVVSIDQNIYGHMSELYLKRALKHLAQKVN